MIPITNLCKVQFSRFERYICFVCASIPTVLANWWLLVPDPHAQISPLHRLNESALIPPVVDTVLYASNR